jgi:hypothetical protein
MKSSTKAMLFGGLGNSLALGATAGLFSFIGAGRGVDKAVSGLAEGVSVAEATEVARAGAQTGAALWAGIGTGIAAGGAGVLTAWMSQPSEEEKPGK